MTPVRVALVGLGTIAEEHFDKLGRLDDVEVVGVCDLSQTLVDAVVERFGVGPGYTSYERMLEEARPGSVHVLTPPQTHRELVMKALEASANVLVEKPITPTWDEYVELRDAAAERGLLLVENYNYRFMDVVVQALALVRDGTVGEPVNVDASMGVGSVADPDGPYTDPDLPHFAHSLPGGALQNFVSHPASLVLAVMDTYESVRVSQRRLGAASVGSDELRALVSGERACGVLTVTAHAAPPVFTVQVLGTKGTIEVDVFGRRLHLQRAGSAVERVTGGLTHGIGHLSATGKAVARTLTGRQDYFEGFERLLRGFYAATNGAPPPVTSAEMDAVNRLVRDLFDPANQA